MNYILFDGDRRENLLPFTFTRPVADIRVGILSIREKWEHWLKTKTSILTQDYLSVKFPLHIEKENTLICASFLPDEDLVRRINNLQLGEALSYDNRLVAIRLSDDEVSTFNESQPYHGTELKTIEEIANTWDIFSKNGEAIRSDFERLTSGRISTTLSETNFIRGKAQNIFIEPGAVVEYAYLNTESGPIYIDKDAEIMEGAKIRGPFSLGKHAVVKMDAKIYKDTTVGPWCKVGGEISNAVFFGYANKGHDGYLGNAVIGEWCNLGADTNNSNLKNTYDIVKLWDYQAKRFVSTGLQFCGLMLGDHSKSGINSMFNTGTVVGVSCNLFGSGFQRNYVSSFSWGGAHGYKAFNLQKAIAVAEAVYKRRGLVFDQVEQDIFKHISELPSSIVR